MRPVTVLEGRPGQPPGATSLEEGRVRGEWERPGALVGGMENAVLPWGLALGGHGPDDDQGAGGQPEEPRGRVKEHQGEMRERVGGRGMTRADSEGTVGM